jgi:hypothetical protein
LCCSGHGLLLREHRIVVNDFAAIHLDASLLDEAFSVRHRLSRGRGSNRSRGSSAWQAEARVLEGQIGFVMKQCWRPDIYSVSTVCSRAASGSPPYTIAGFRERCDGSRWQLLARVFPAALSIVGSRI